MEPDAKLVSPQRLILLLWSSVAVANGVLSLLGPNGWQETARVLSANLCGLILSLLLSLVTQNLLERGQRHRLLFLSLLVLLGGTILWAIDTTLQLQSFRTLSIHWPSAVDLVDRRFNMVYYDLLLTLQTAAQALLRSNQTLKAREGQLAESRWTAQQAQLTALRFQLNPHFLFNSLNAVSSLAAEAGATEAEEMLDRLADFLRATLSFDPQDFITLERELETIQAYLDIEFVRFGERMTIDYICGPEVRDALVPSFILQPLVENAVKYAVTPSREMVQIIIRATETSGKLLLEVEDVINSCRNETSTAEGTGVGLKNVAERLKVLYQDRADLRVTRSEYGFTATIRLPLERPFSPLEEDHARLSG